MLQPRTYPELISKALVLDAAPFVALSDDDDPWIEGMFLTVCVGFLVGFTHLIGRLLTTAALPPSEAMLSSILQAWRQFSPSTPDSINPALAEAALREAWSVLVFWNGYSGGWARLLTLVTTPVILLVQWLVAGVIIHVMARFLGGKGAFNQTLGVTALMVAPQALRLVEIVPFAAVSQLLLSVWALLIIYRAVEVTHDLPWQQALLAAVTPWLLSILLGVILGALVGAGIMVWRIA